MQIKLAFINPESGELLDTLIVSGDDLKTHIARESVSLDVLSILQREMKRIENNQ